MATQMKLAEEGALPDALKIHAFVGELLKREDRRDLLGVLYRHMVGLVQRFAGTSVEESVADAVSDILHKTCAFYYSDLICGENRPWVLRRVFELMNRKARACAKPPEIPAHWYPTERPPAVCAEGRALVSFIVPVYNAERYISSTIESLRRQTLSDFEIICVDDGSVDDSGKILDFYAGTDSRIRVWHLENGGVSRARNFGLSKAVGKYVAFVDGDDRLLPQMAAETVLAAERDALDAVMFDFKCFDSSTLNEIDHYWRLAHHAEHFPAERVFSLGELENLPVYGSSCTYLWNRGFLEKAGVAFPGIRLGEDLVWLLLVLSKVRRMRMVNIPFYEYRRNNPSSAVSRLQTNESDAPVYALKGLADVLANVDDRRLRRLYLKRMVSDILFYGEKNAKARSYLQCGGFDGFGGLEYLKRVCSENEYARISALVNGEVRNDAPPDIEYFIRQTPRGIRRIMRRAIEDRKNFRKDLIVVAGQLNSTTNEPIDSWTFFRWLQNNGIPCRYVVWRKHRMLDKMRADNALKDVVLLSGNGVDDYEFIQKLKDVLPRIKAVVMENTALNPLVWRYFHMLEECGYVFLQHGVTFWKKSPAHIGSFAVANYVNVASEEEKKFLEKRVPMHWETKNKPEYLLAGLPRWDLLRDESGSEKEKVVFFMPTWRATFNSGMDALTRSAYYSEIKKLVCRENLDRLKKRGIRFLMAAHHHLVNRVKDLDFDLPVELVPTSEISYWIRHASLCITDYSSVSFDFLFLNKPCIFWTPDRYDGLLKGDDYSEVIFAGYQGRNMFNRVDSVEDVMAMVEKYADTGFVLEPEKRAISDRYFAFRSNVCARLYNQICSVDEKEVEQ